MKMTMSQRIMALALAICLVIGMVPSFGLVPKVEAAPTDSWQMVYRQSNSQLTADTNNPFNVSFTNRLSAYYTEKIDVAAGTKIS